MTHGSLFSGIGGFDLAAEWAGWENTFQVEINDWCRRVLKKNFPNAQQYGDIKQFSGINWRGKIDVISGGFPCQPYSSAGLRKGTDDERHLWPEMLRVIREVAPRWVVGENVFGIVTWENGLVFEQVHIDLEAEGYEVQAFVLPAASTNAPHRRDRTWFIAHSKSARKFGRVGDIREEERGQGGTLLQRTHGTNSGFSFDTKSTRTGEDNRRIRKEFGGRSGGEGTDKKESATGDGHAADTGREHGARTQNSGELERQTGSGNASESQRSTGRDTIRTTAHTENIGQQFCEQEPKTGKNTTTRADRSQWERSWIEVAAELCGLDDGLPVELDGFTLSKSKHREHQLKGLGNAIVPQVALEIFKAIDTVDRYEQDRQ